MESTRKILIIVFCLVISLPGCILLLGIEAKPDSYEFKKVAEKPTFSFKDTPKGFYSSVNKFKKDFEKYINERLLIRSTLLDINKQIKTRVFNTNSHPLKVITGADGWMFGVDIDNVMNQTIGEDYLSEVELINIERNLNSIKRFLDEKNIKYYFLIAPNKHSVYYSKMGFNEISSFRIKHQLLNILDQANIPYVDPVEKLIIESSRGPVFYKTDTHWNNYGAYFAFEALLKKINYDFNLPNDSYVILNSENKQSYEVYCDLIRMTRSFEQESYTNNITLLSRAKRINNTLDVPLNFKRKKDDYEKRYWNSSKNLKVVVFRDSFSEALIDYFSANFREVVFIWNRKFSRQIIEKEQPDIVITEVVERLIPHLINYDQQKHGKNDRDLPQ